MVKPTTKRRRAEEDAISAMDEEEETTDSGSDAPEEESNAIGRKNIRGLDKSRQSAQRRALKRAKGLEAVKDAEARQEFPENDQGTISNAAEDSALKTVASHRLDPSLFAEAFAKKGHKSSKGNNNHASQAKSSAKPLKKRSNLAVGRDGHPMKRLKDGRTTVRVLPKPIRFSEEIENEDRAKEKIEETYRAPAAVDPSEILPNAKVRAFRKYKLGLKDSMPQSQKKAESKSLRTEDDPLGLQDPAFMKGGEFFGRVNASKKMNTATPKPNLSKGRRTKFTPSMVKHGQALHFARSL